jgi:hypothetical protein
MQNSRNQTRESKEENLPADTGNASNPAPTNTEQTDSNQLLDKKAEKYLREVASIEDVPDAQDQQDMDETLGKKEE